MKLLKELSLNIKTYTETPKPTVPQPVDGETSALRSADFSNISSTTTRSPSPRAGSGSVCALQPSERGPPLQREDKRGRDNKQKEGKRRERETNLISPVLEEATNIVQKMKYEAMQPHTEQMGDGCVRGDGGGGGGVNQTRWWRIKPTTDRKIKCRVNEKKK